MSVELSDSRINWMDWAKVMAIILVVFGHVPQEKGDFLVSYVCTFHMPLFFMLSGYLSKHIAGYRQIIKKQYNSLVIPYIFYNFVFYPYWLVRYIVDYQGNLTIGDMVAKPLLGMLFFQIDTSFSSNLNGATWFLVALLVMRILQNVCYRFSHPKKILVLTSFVMLLLCIVSEYYNMTDSLFVKGFLRCYPFYVIGHFMRIESWLNRYVIRNNFLSAMTYHGLGVMLYIYMSTKVENIVIYVFLYYFITLIASLAVIYTCRCFNNHTSDLLINLSNGTVAIMGLHWMFIGSFNFALERIMGVVNITYSWYVSILLSLVICILIYPFIFFSSKYFPLFLGKTKSLNNKSFISL